MPTTLAKRSTHPSSTPLLDPYQLDHLPHCRPRQAILTHHPPLSTMPACLSACRETPHTTFNTRLHAATKRSRDVSGEAKSKHATSQGWGAFGFAPGDTFSTRVDDRYIHRQGVEIVAGARIRDVRRWDCRYLPPAHLPGCGEEGSATMGWCACGWPFVHVWRWHGYCARSWFACHLCCADTW